MASKKLPPCDPILGVRRFAGPTSFDWMGMSKKNPWLLFRPLWLGKPPPPKPKYPPGYVTVKPAPRWPRSRKPLLSLLHVNVLLLRGLEGIQACMDVWGDIPVWDCFDPPTHDLSLCDFHHQRAGIDCWPKSPPKPHASTLLTADDHGSAHVQGALPPCKDVPGGIQNWDCYDPPATPLPPCDYKHQNPGIDCSAGYQKPRPPPAPKGDLN